MAAQNSGRRALCAEKRASKIAKFVTTRSINNLKLPSPKEVQSSGEEENCSEAVVNPIFYTSVHTLHIKEKHG